MNHFFALFLQSETVQSITGIAALDNAVQIVINYAPKVLGAILLLILAWIVASIVRWVARKGLSALGVTDRLASNGSEEGTKVIKTLSDVVFWIVFLCFIPGILSTLGLTGALEPIQNMLSSILTYLPSVLAAGLIFILGMLAANIIKELLTSFLTNVGLNSFAEKNGVSFEFAKGGLAGLVGTIVHAVILLAVLSASLSALSIEAISNPITSVVDRIVSMIPNLFGATIVLVIAYFVARIVRGLVTDVLTGVGFNKIPAMIGLSNLPQEGEKTASTYVGHLVFLAIVISAVAWAANILGFEALNNAIQVVAGAASGVITGIVILAIGMYVANLVAGLIKDSGVNSAKALSTIARVAILFIVGAMALTHMGVGTEIVSTAFSYSLGALAVAAALAFGLGGKDFAARKLEEINDSFGSAEPAPKPEQEG